ncbi:Polysaccharide pyruvyl transferase [Balamuthia mandrillaris]
MFCCRSVFLTLLFAAVTKGGASPPPLTTAASVTTTNTTDIEATNTTEDHAEVCPAVITEDIIDTVRGIPEHLYTSHASCEQTLPVYFWDGKLRWNVTNVGDEVNKDLMSFLLNRPQSELLLTASTLVSPKLLAVGSVLQFAQPGDLVWGSGIHDASIPNTDWEALKQVKMLALRGPFSRQRLRQNNVTCSVNNFGDPGLLVPFVFPSLLLEAKRDYTRVHPHCFLPHNSHESHLDQSPLKEELERNNVTVLLTRNQPYQQIEALWHCHHVVSTSLHGLVFAHALGIPATWLFDMSLPLNPGVFKFRDYFYSLNMRSKFWASNMTEALTGAKAQVPQLQKLMKSWLSLAESFPFNDICRNGDHVKETFRQFIDALRTSSQVVLERRGLDWEID